MEPGSPDWVGMNAVPSLHVLQESMMRYLSKDTEMSKGQAMEYYATFYQTE